MKKIPITLSTFEREITSEPFYKTWDQTLEKTRKLIFEEIKKLTGDDESEISRIKDACHWYQKDKPSDDKEPTYVEFFLSAAVWELEFSDSYYYDGDLKKALACFADANHSLGAARGNGLAENLQFLKNKELGISKSRKMLQSKAAKREKLIANLKKYWEDNGGLDMKRTEDGATLIEESDSYKDAESKQPTYGELIKLIREWKKPKTGKT